MTETNELRIAVIGAGPAGVYSSDIFLRQLKKLGEELGLGTAARIDLFEKLPVPFGLVRYGVAPDHPSIKFIASALEKTLDNPDIHLYCDVEFGKDVTLDDLLALDAGGFEYEAEAGASRAQLSAESFLQEHELPVINLAGCPTHPTTITRSLALIADGQPLELDALNRPRAFYGSTVHQGCTRNEYHEYDLEETQFGGRGCLFFNLGCQGPNTLANCNSELWNRRSSKPRAGVPCFGCTSPDFPRDGDLFRTEKLGAVPLKLPRGVSRAQYMAYKNLAHAAAPKRVKDRDMEP